MGNEVAAAVVHGNVTKTTRLPNKASIFRAELHAILLALSLIRRSKEKNFIITVARDSGRLLYFGRVSFSFSFRPPNFRRPWADFRDTLPHDAVCAEIVYLL